MKNHRFPWLRNRTTDNRKCEKARNIKEKRTIEMFNTASRLHVAHLSSPRDNRGQEIFEKARKYAISGLFLYPNPFDSFSRILKKNRSDLVVNTGATTP